jgi:hypothetical protein
MPLVFCSSAVFAEAGNGDVIIPLDEAEESLQLQEALESRGWQVDHDAEGSTYLVPKQNRAAVGPGKSLSGPANRSVGDFEHLRDELANRGWRVERGSGGMTYLFPVQKSPVQHNQPTSSQADNRMMGGFDRLRDELENRGWRVKQADDGSLFLFPASIVFKSDVKHMGAQGNVTNLLVSSADLPQLQNLLDSNGWRLQQSPNGLYIQSPRNDRSPKDAVVDDKGKQYSDAVMEDDQQVESIQPTSNTTHVNSKREALEVSMNWLMDQGMEDLAVGGILDIKRFYVVVIVESAPPNRLRNELVISKSTGRLVSAF